MHSELRVLQPHPTPHRWNSSFDSSDMEHGLAICTTDEISMSSPSDLGLCDSSDVPLARGYILNADTQEVSREELLERLTQLEAAAEAKAEAEAEIDSDPITLPEPPVSKPRKRRRPILLWMYLLTLLSGMALIATLWLVGGGIAGWQLYSDSKAPTVVQTVTVPVAVLPEGEAGEAAAEAAAPATSTTSASATTTAEPAAAEPAAAEPAAASEPAAIRATTGSAAEPRAPATASRATSTTSTAAPVTVKILTNPPAATLVVDNATTDRAPAKLQLTPGGHAVAVTAGDITRHFAISVTESGANKWCYDLDAGKLFEGSCQ